MALVAKKKKRETKTLTKPPSESILLKAQTEVTN